MNDQVPTEPENTYKFVLIGVFAGLLLVAGPVLLWFGFEVIVRGARTANLWNGYGLTSLVILPLVQAGLTGYAAQRAGKPVRFVSFTLGIIALDYLMAVFVLREGVICLILGFPLFFLEVVTGLEIGRSLARLRSPAAVRASVIPLVLLAVAVDSGSARTVYANAISDAVTIDAPPEAVWRYIVDYPENTAPPEYWLWKIGMPVPIQSTAREGKVGAARQCRFTDGIAFQEEITEIVANKVMTFKVTKQPDHPELTGHFNLDKGQLYLEANADGTTTVIATSWYRIHVSPAFYFDWWAADITRNIHFRVLNHIKRLAEADRAKAA